MNRGNLCIVILSVILALWFGAQTGAEERTERFDTDPKWDGYNNRAAVPEPRTIKQDFGYSRTTHAGGVAEEVGGFFTPAAEPAYYGKKIPTRTFRDALSASGTLACDGRPAHILIGFFNAGTLNEWRTPNTIALRISGRGDVFYAWVEYATQRWRAGGDSPRGFPTVIDPKTSRPQLKGFAAKGAVHTWSLRYDPDGNDGNGVITATIGEVTAVCHLDKGHKADGAEFNRFGLLNVMKHADTGGGIWVDEVTINGQKEDFSRDPGWEGFQNRRTYVTQDIRPRFAFGYSPTHHAGGRAKGELGGLVFRGDCRYPHTVAYYGDRLDPLNLEKPLKASGTVSLQRGVTDSTTLIGFFHARDSMEVNPSQESGIPRCFLGAAIEGPSREGFHFYPLYRVRGQGQGNAKGPALPRILPDGTAHAWSLAYVPAADGKGRMTITFDKEAFHLDLGAEHRATGARFDRFGIITTWIDGNGQRIYFDDVNYTYKQE
jgi:hypothetical protein